MRRRTDTHAAYYLAGAEQYAAANMLITRLNKAAMDGTVRADDYRRIKHIALVEHDIDAAAVEFAKLIDSHYE